MTAAQAGLVVGLLAVSAFAYALTLRTRAFSKKRLAFALLIPTVVVVPFLYGLSQSYFMTQIFSMVIAMSTDITLSFNMVRAVVAATWFLLGAVVLLALKGRSPDRFPLQQALGLILVLSGSFLFNYANYVLLSTLGVLLITIPLVRKRTD